MAVVACVAAMSQAPAARADLIGDVRQILSQDALKRAQVGIEIVRLGSTPAQTQILLQHNSTRPLVPASNLKLITTSAFLDAMGPDFRFHTLLVRHGDDLALIGDGDPTFGDAELLKKFGWDTTTVFTNWATGLVQHGLTQFNRVIVDDSVFDTQFVQPHWPPEQYLKRYVAEVAGLSLNDNCLDFTVQTTTEGNLVHYQMNPPTRYVTMHNVCVTGNGNSIWLARPGNTNDVTLHGNASTSTDVPVSVTVHDPALFVGTVLAETMLHNGVKLNGPVQRDRTLRAALTAYNATGANPTTRPVWQMLAVHETPLPQVLARCNKDSVNLYAESLCKRLGFQNSHQSGSWENGPAAVGLFLTRIGVAPTEFHLDDGCGLSKENTISPGAITKVLAYDFFSKNRDVFMASLSIGGTDGTLEKRFLGTDLRGRVFGKSGYINNVSSLSGYLHAKDGQWYAFSILANQFPAGTVGTVKQLQEMIVRAIDVDGAVAGIELDKPAR